jgi:hypothetical protein
MRIRDVAGLIVAQDPDAVRLRTVDWGSSAVPEQERWLAPGDTIAAASWDVDGATLVSSGFDTTTTTAKIGGVTRAFAEGGHKIRVRVTSTNGEIQDVTFTLVAQEA